MSFYIRIFCSVLVPLSLVYIVGFTVAYTHIGSMLNISFGVVGLYTKLSVVTSLCLGAIFLACKRTNNIGKKRGTHWLAVTLTNVTLVTIAGTLAIATPYLALGFGVSYR